MKIVISESQYKLLLEGDDFIKMDANEYFTLLKVVNYDVELLSSLPPINNRKIILNGFVEGDLELPNTITSLPDNLTVVGDLVLPDSNITSIPDNLSVGKDLNLENTKITSIPDNLRVGRDLNLINTPISEMHDKDEILKMIENKGGYVWRGIYTTDDDNWDFAEDDDDYYTDDEFTDDEDDNDDLI